MAIPNHIIEKIRNNTDLVSVIQDYVQLKRRGTNFIACCPFHNEKSPSFYVSPAKQIYKCFGCGKAGDVISFVKEIDGLNYVQAIKFLGGKLGLEIEDEKLSPEAELQQTERDSIYIVLSWAKNLFKNLLTENEEGKSIGYSYFKERGLSEESIQTFELGYSMPQRDFLLKEALKVGYTEQVLEKAGLISKRDDGSVLDRFRGRVMFPIYNASGKVLGFGARILGNDKNVAKYLNSPETEVYHKSDVLYGLTQAKNHIRQANNAYMTEGYLDVIAMHQAGVKNVVASSGTSLTVEQIRLLKRYAGSVTVLYDGDAAGIKASIRGIDLLLEEDMEVRACLFPDGDDPDSYLKKVGALNFEIYLKQNSQDFVSFKIGLFAAEASEDPYKRSSLINDMVASIMKIPNAIRRAVCFTQCAKALQVDEQLLISEGNKILLELQRGKQARQRRQEFAAEENAAEQVGEMLEKILPTVSLKDPLLAAIEQYERESIRMVITYGDKLLGDDYYVADFYEEELSQLAFSTSIYEKLYAVFKAQMDAGLLPTSQFFMQHPDIEIQEAAISLLSVNDRYQVSEGWMKAYEITIAYEQDNLKTEVSKDMLRLKLKNTDKIMRDMILKMDEATEEAQLECMTLLLGYQTIKKTIADQLGRVVG